MKRDDAWLSFVLCQDDRKFSERREDEGMGTGDIKYGDTFVFLQHMKSSLWLSYQTFETKKRGVGRVEEKKACDYFDRLTLIDDEEYDDDDDDDPLLFLTCYLPISIFKIWGWPH